MTGKAENLGQGIRRLIAPNPSVMTEKGTNTYLVGSQEICVIDPGPEIETHLDAIQQAASGAPITRILVTHAHRDHSALARRLKDLTGAAVLAFGGPTDGRSETMQALATAGEIGGGEGLDETFRPDGIVAHGDMISHEDTAIEVLHTPGHFAGHLSFALGNVIFTGDAIMGWSTSLISPPDGDVGAFRRSCLAIGERKESVLYPGHGAPVTEPRARIAELLAHRAVREAQIIEAIEKGHRNLSAISEAVYGPLVANRHSIASRNTLAHLIDLWQQNRVTIDDEPSLATQWHPA